MRSAWRVVVGLMAIIVAIARPQWPDRAGIGHSIVAGLLVHGFYLGGTAVAISHSIPAGLSALIPGLQPILTSTLANRWLGERVTPLQWTGLLLGLAGVVLILHDRPMSGEAGWGWLASGVSLVSITLGTLYQRRYCNAIDWRAGNLVQYIAVTMFFGLGAWLFENNVVHWTAEFVLALSWLAVVLSIGSIGLLYWLIRRSAATSVASLFYLVPAVTVADGLCAVRRTARCGRDRRHDGLRGRGVSGQPPRGLNWLASIAGLRVSRQRAFAADFVIDDRLRIGLAEFDACACKFERRRGPGLVDQICRAVAPAPAPSAGHRRHRGRISRPAGSD